MPSSNAARSRTRAGFIRPRALGPGSTIALVSPSDPAAHLFPGRIERAAQTLARAGMHLRVSEASMAIRADRPYLAGDDDLRARDLQQAFADPQVDAVWSSIGGMNSNRLLDRLDFAAIARQPKVLLGYSDLTCLLNAIHAATGLVTFHGPNLAVEWGDGAPDPFTAAALWRTVGRPEAAGPLPRPETCRLEPWPPGAAQPVPATPWRGNGAGSAEGALVGGNLQTLMRLVGTPWWPSFDGRVLFWEDVGLPEHALDAMLSHLRVLGVFEAVSAVVVGKVVPPDERSLYAPERLIALTQDAAGRRLPIVAGLDIGHTDPMLTLPIGVCAQVDAQAATVSLMEGAVCAGGDGKGGAEANQA